MTRGMERNGGNGSNRHNDKRKDAGKAGGTRPGKKKPRDRPKCVRLNDWLPDHLAEMVLDHLPIESLCRFRCVSREWNSSIMRVISNRNWIIRHGKDKKSIDIRNGLKEPWTRLPLELLTYCDYIISSSKGLCLIHNRNDPFGLILNPMTGCRSRALQIDFSLEDTFVGFEAEIDTTDHTEFRLVVVKMTSSGCHGGDKDQGRITGYDSRTDKWSKGSTFRGSVDLEHGGKREELMLGCVIVDSRLFFLTRTHGNVSLKSVPLLVDCTDITDSDGVIHGRWYVGEALQRSTELMLGHCDGKFVMIVRMPSFREANIYVLEGNERIHVAQVKLPRMSRMFLTCHGEELTLRFDNNWCLVYNVRTKSKTSERNNEPFLRYSPSFRPMRAAR